MTKNLPSLLESVAKTLDSDGYPQGAEWVREAISRLKFIPTPAEWLVPERVSDGSSPSQKMETESRFDSSGPAPISISGLNVRHTAERLATSQEHITARYVRLERQYAELMRAATSKERQS